MALTTRTNQLLTLRARIRKAEDQLKRLKAQKDVLEKDALEELQESGLESARTSKGTMTIQRTKVPQIEDFDAFWKWTRRNNKPELFQRRVSVTAWRELIEIRKDGRVPGLSEYERVTLQLHEAKD